MHPLRRARNLFHAASRPRESTRGYVLGVLFLVYMLNFIDRQVPVILAQDIKAGLGLSDAQLGFLYGTAFAIFYSLFGIPLGRLADSWYRGRLIAAGLIFWSVMTALSGLARSYGQLALARIGVGIVEASASPAAYSLLINYFPHAAGGSRSPSTHRDCWSAAGLSAAGRLDRARLVSAYAHRSRAVRARRLAGRLSGSRSSWTAACPLGIDAA